MKRLLMLLTTFCLLLMTTALAETEAEWNAKCEWKTGTGTTLYAVTQGTATSSDLSDFVPVGTLPANTYVGILERSGNMRNVRYWNGSGTSSGWVDSAALVWVGSNSSKPKPSGSRATASDLSRKPDDTWNSLTVTYSAGDEAQTVSLQTLGVAMSEIYMDGEFLRVPTASLSWETEADDNQRIAVIYAPSTGKCTMREEASKKGKIIMTCKAGRVVTVLRVGDVYTRIVYDGVEGLAEQLPEVLRNAGRGRLHDRSAVRKGQDEHDRNRLSISADEEPPPSGQDSRRCLSGSDGQGRRMVRGGCERLARLREGRERDAGCAAA